MTQRAIDLLNQHLPASQRNFDRDAATGYTPDELVFFVDESAAADWIKRSALSIVRAYGLRGSCDPAYIANLIDAQYANRGDNHK